MKTEAKSILLVDDDPIVLNTLKTGLARAGYKVAACADGQTAVRAYSDSPPDLAVIDIELPDIQGAELAARLLRIQYRPIFVLSTHDDPDCVREAIGSGVVGYLVKPVSSQQLVPSIETGLARFSEMNRRIAARFDQESGASADLSDLIEQFPFGILVIDRDHRMLQCNSRARSLLKDGTLVTNVRGQLRPGTRTEGFQQMLDAAVGAHRPRRPGVVCVESGGTRRKIQLWANPIPGSGDPSQGSAILVAVNPDTPPTAPPALLKALYGLTATESVLVQALLDGHSLEEYARRRCVSLNTVRTHLKAIYRKTHTHGQVDLVRLFSRLFAYAPVESDVDE